MLLRAQQHRLSTAGKKLFPSASQRAASPAASFRTALSPSIRAAQGVAPQHRRFGAFLARRDNGSGKWYRHSLRTVVADLKEELEQEPEQVVPAKTLNPIQSPQLEQEPREADPSKVFESIQSLRNVLQGRATPSNVNHAFSLLDQLVAEKSGRHSDSSFSQLNTAILNDLVGRWKECWSHETNRSQKGFKLLSPWTVVEKMEIYQDSFPGLLPKTETYNCILSVASENYNNEDAHQLGLFVQSVVEQMETQANHEGSKRVHPDRSTYNILVQTWARAGNIQRVQDVIMSLESWSDIQLTRETLTAVSKASAAQLEAISKVQKNLGLPSLPNGASKVVPDLKRQMEDSDPREDLPSFIDSDAKEDLRLIAYWIAARSGEGISKAFRRLDELLLSESCKENVPTYLINDLLKSWLKCRGRKKTQIPPEQVMEKVLAYHDDERNEFRLDTRTFNTLMKAVATGSCFKTKKLGLQLCKHLFKRMEQDATTAPDSETYNRFIIRSAGAEDIQGSLKLLGSLLERQKSQNQPGNSEIQINAACFVTILRECFRMERHKKSQSLGPLAGRILDLMDQLEEAGILTPGDRRVKARIYSVAERCWEESGHPEAPEKIKEIRQRWVHEARQSRIESTWDKAQTL